MKQDGCSLMFLMYFHLKDLALHYYTQTIGLAKSGIYTFKITNTDIIVHMFKHFSRSYLTCASHKTVWETHSHSGLSPCIQLLLCQVKVSFISPKTAGCHECPESCHSSHSLHYLRFTCVLPECVLHSPTLFKPAAIICRTDMAVQAQSLASCDSCFQNWFNEVPVDAARKLNSTLPILIIRVNRGWCTQAQRQNTTTAPCYGPANPRGRKNGRRQRCGRGEGGKKRRRMKRRGKVDQRFIY